jgi:hypothetical protein
MIDLTSKTRHPSKLLPDVTIVIKKMSMGVRLALRKETAAAARRLVEASDEVQRVSKEFNDSIKDLSAQEQATTRWPKELTDAFEAAAAEQEAIDKAYIDVCLVSIDGATIDGKPITASDVYERCGPEFFREVSEVIKSEYGLTEREKGESAPPSISGAAEGGSAKSFSAEPASEEATTFNGTADVTSPVM